MAIVAMVHVALGSRLGISITDEASASSLPKCNSNSDCSLKVRSRFPTTSTTGVGLCECYAASSKIPFDECEGESDATCAVSRCGNSCSGQIAICKFIRRTGICFAVPVDAMGGVEHEELVGRITTPE